MRLALCLGVGIALAPSCSGDPGSSHDTSPIARRQGPDPAMVDFPPELAHEPGYRARVVAAEGSRGTDSWSDIRVPGLADAARQLCDRVVEYRVRMLSGAGLRPRLARPCRVDPLPPIQLTSRSSVLVSSQSSSGAELLLLGPTELDGADLVAVVTDFARFSSQVECQRAVARLAEIRARDEGEAAEARRRFLDDEIAREEEAERRACAKPEIGACGATGATDRAFCEMERRRVERTCSDARSAAEMVRQRRAAEPTNPGPAATSPASPAVCRSI